MVVTDREYSIPQQSFHSSMGWDLHITFVRTVFIEPEREVEFIYLAGVQKNSFPQSWLLYTTKKWPGKNLYAKLCCLRGSIQENRRQRYKLDQSLVVSKCLRAGGIRTHARNNQRLENSATVPFCRYKHADTL